jgi:hypothetical protein
VRLGNGCDRLRSDSERLSASDIAGARADSSGPGGVLKAKLHSHHQVERA